MANNTLNRISTIEQHREMIFVRTLIVVATEELMGKMASMNRVLTTNWDVYLNARYDCDDGDVSDTFNQIKQIAFS